LRVAQVVRLALAPVGHALGRTPSQNVRTARFRMMERGTWLSELDPITSSTDDTLELQAGSAKLLRMPHSREVRALSQERRRSINSRSKARNSFILVRTCAI